MAEKVTWTTVARTRNRMGVKVFEGVGMGGQSHGTLRQGLGEGKGR